MKKYITFAIIVLIGTGIAFYNINVAWFFLVASMAVILLANLDELESISLLGLRAKLKKQIDESKATIEQLRNLAKAMGKVHFNNIISRITGRQTDNQQIIQDIIDDLYSIITCLHRLGISHDEIEDTASEMNKRLIDIAERLNITLPTDRLNIIFPKGEQSE